MLQTTAKLLQHRGYHGTSLNDILEGSGAPRGSLYFHFPGGKDQLVLEATRASIDETTQWLRGTLATAATPAKAVRLYLEAAAGLMVDSKYTFGCPVAPLILDANAGLPELADLCRRAFEEWMDLLASSFVQAGVPEQRASSLALLVSSSLEGGLLISRSYRYPEPLMTLAAELEAILTAVLSQADDDVAYPQATRSAIAADARLADASAIAVTLLSDDLGSISPSLSDDRQ
jgi:TetR/AcrR family transcriptional repressor of lmrAB and yxaGH operons